MVDLSVPQGFPSNSNHMPGGPDIEPITLVLSNSARCSFAGGGTATLAGPSGAGVSTPITTVCE
ncbi:hypothetical protein [Streptomyces sp. TLI_55]|uniref:hypothetical protein n=1 Tax=Streptomyces sp. TLI_55 TaxID=1938861 RepID=UPI000BE3DB04|nr:hypothetical protein [Streptomyces sp. TLI_55]